MSDIVLSSGVRANLLQLQKTASLITDTQTKLATGKRVNTALDNPINYFTAQGLSNRATDLGNLLDSMSTAINTIQAANNGLTSITKLPPTDIKAGTATMLQGAIELSNVEATMEMTRATEITRSYELAAK